MRTNHGSQRSWQFKFDTAESPACPCSHPCGHRTSHNFPPPHVGHPASLLDRRQTAVVRPRRTHLGRRRRTSQQEGRNGSHIFSACSPNDLISQLHSSKTFCMQLSLFSPHTVISFRSLSITRTVLTTLSNSDFIASALFTFVHIIPK